MAYHYDADITIVKICSAIPSYGCYIHINCGTDSCEIISGLGEKDPKTKIDLLLEAVITNGTIRKKEVSMHEFFEDSLPIGCIPSIEKAIQAAIKQEYQYHEQIE